MFEDLGARGEGLGKKVDIVIEEELNRSLKSRRAWTPTWGHNHNINDTTTSTIKLVGTFLGSELDMKEHSLIHGNIHRGRYFLPKHSIVQSRSLKFGEIRGTKSRDCIPSCLCRESSCVASNCRAARDVSKSRRTD